MRSLPGALALVTELSHSSRYHAPRSPVTPYRLKPGLELVEIVVGGQVDFLEEGRLRTFTRGAMFWHVAGEETIHLNHVDDPYRCVSIHFKVEPGPSRRPTRVCVWKDPEQAAAFGELVYELTHSSAYSSDFKGVHAYSRILLEAEQALRARKEAEPRPLPLRKAIRFIEGNFHLPIGLPQIASHAGISVPYLHGLFSAHLLKSPHRMILDLRLRKARKILLETDARLREIASLTGFASPEYFCRIFTRTHGLPPVEYRKRYTRLGS